MNNTKTFQERAKETTPEATLKYRDANIFVRCLTAELLKKSKEYIGLKLMVTYRTKEAFSWTMKTCPYVQTIVILEWHDDKERDQIIAWLYNQQVNKGLDLAPMEAIKNLEGRNIYISRKLLES